NTHAATEALAVNAIQSTVATGIGTVTKTVSLDLSTILGRPTQPDDEFHISVSLDNTSNLVEGRVSLDVDASVNTFTQNYYYFSFRASDLQAAVSQAVSTLTAQQQGVQRAQVDAYIDRFRKEGLPLPPGFPSTLGVPSAQAT